MKQALPIVAAVLAVLSPRLVASPFKAATMSLIVNDVEVLGARSVHHRAAEGQILDSDATVRVGAQSRAEVVFADRTVARLGAETSVTLHPGTRDLSLDRGTILLHVPKFHGGARIRTGSLTVECSGATILAEHLPGNSLKAVVLAGEMRVFAPGFLGDSIVIPAGRMLITSPEVDRIPDPVDTDIRTIVKTSALIDPAAFAGRERGRVTPLPSLPSIEREIARQDASFKKKWLILTNLVIVGSGTKVVIPNAGDADAPADGAGNVSTTNRNREERTRKDDGKGAPLVVGQTPFQEAALPEP